MAAPPKRTDADLQAFANKALSYPTHAHAAASMGMSIVHVRRLIYEARAKGLRLVAHPRPQLSTDERRDASFWQAKTTALFKELGQTKRALEEVSGLMQRPIDAPTWTLPKPGRKNRAIGLLHVSDIHGGEVVKVDEVNGLNAYDLDICRRRLRTLFGATIEILPRWASDCKLDGIVVALNGDLVSGDIHDELRETNALTAQQQVYFVADELAAGLEKLVDKFGALKVVVTPGNHGRSTKKTHAKNTAGLSYDTMIGEQLRRHFNRDKRVTVIVSPSRDAEYEILGWKVLQTHGDQGGGGGQGFAGPMLPVLRKSKQAEFMAAQSRIFFDLILNAHFHTSGHPTTKILQNGSVVGYSEFSRSIRGSPELPMQWLSLVHERWCLRERMEIKLETATKA